MIKMNKEIKFQIETVKNILKARNVPYTVIKVVIGSIKIAYITGKIDGLKGSDKHGD